MRFVSAAVLCLAAGSALLACSSSSSAGVASTTAPATAGASTTAAPASTVTVPATTSTASTSSLAPASTTVAPTTIPPSPTGVPGIAAPDAFCAAWSRYSGSLQIVAVAVNFAGLTSVQSATLELESAPTVVDAVGEIDRSWPTALASEHSAALDAYLGPFARRAGKAVEALRGAGVTDAQLAAMRAQWEHVLATRNPDSPTVDVQLPADLAGAVDAGATAFDAAVTPWGSDPSLAVDLDSIPHTKRYLAERCPDLASIGVGDDV